MIPVSRLLDLNLGTGLHRSRSQYRPGQSLGPHEPAVCAETGRPSHCSHFPLTSFLAVNSTLNSQVTSPFCDATRSVIASSLTFLFIVSPRQLRESASAALLAIDS